MFKIIIAIGLVILSGYWVYSSVQRTMEAGEEREITQEAADKANKAHELALSELEQSNAFYKSYGCTQPSPEIWNCPAGTPDFNPS